MPSQDRELSVIEIQDAISASFWRDRANWLWVAPSSSRKVADSSQARLAIDIKKEHPDWPLTVFVRNTKVDEWFKSTAKADRIVHGSISDTELVRSLSKEHDIVVNAITSFDGDFVANIISGLEERSEDSKGTLIHVSGTGNFIDYGKTGAFDSDSKVWSVSMASIVESRGC